MKQTAKRRLVLDREVVKVLAIREDLEHLRHIRGGARDAIEAGPGLLACTYRDSGCTTIVRP
jgi:hypothetical protein